MGTGDNYSSPESLVELFEKRAMTILSSGQIQEKFKGELLDSFAKLPSMSGMFFEKRNSGRDKEFTFVYKGEDDSLKKVQFKISEMVVLEDFGGDTRVDENIVKNYIVSKMGVKLLSEGGSSVEDRNFKDVVIIAGRDTGNFDYTSY